MRATRLAIFAALWLTATLLFATYLPHAGATAGQMDIGTDVVKWAEYHGARGIIICDGQTSLCGGGGNDSSAATTGGVVGGSLDRNVITDGNVSSGIGNNEGAHINNWNYGFKAAIPTPGYHFTTIHARLSVTDVSSLGSVTVGHIDSTGTYVADMTPSITATPTDFWANVTETRSFGFEVVLHTQNSGSFSGLFMLWTLQIFDKGTSTIPGPSFAPWNASYANYMAAKGTGEVGSAALTTGYGSQYMPLSGALAAGTYLAFLYEPFDATTSQSIPWTVLGFGTPMTGIHTEYESYTILAPVRSCRVQVLEFTNPTLQKWLYKPSINSPASVTMCKTTSQKNLFSGLPLTSEWGFVTADLSSFGGTTSDTIGVTYLSNTYPANPVTQSQLISTGNVYFKSANVSLGTTLFATGAPGQISTQMMSNYQTAGNVLLIGLGQSPASKADVSKFSISVNTFPGVPILSMNASGAKFTLFLIDDQARRASLAENNTGTIAEGNDRPFGGESYVIKLNGGFATDKTVNALVFTGREGHGSWTCETIFCFASATMDKALDIPQNFTNYVNFTVKDLVASPLAANIFNGADGSSTVTAASTGFATLKNQFSDSIYTISKSGYRSECFDFHFNIGPVVNQPLDQHGCTQQTATTTTVNVTLLTTAQASTTSNGAITIANTLIPLNVFFTPSNGTFVVPNVVNISANRSSPITLYIDTQVISQGTCAGNPLGGALKWDASQQSQFYIHIPATGPTSQAYVGDYYIGAYYQNASGLHLIADAQFHITNSGGGVNVNRNAALQTQCTAAVSNEVASFNANVNAQATQISQQTIQQAWLNVLGFFFADFLGLGIMPNIALILLLVIIVSVVSVLALSFGRWLNKGV